MNTTAKIALATSAGYLLGRTKKMKLAIGVGLFLAGQKLPKSPLELIQQGAGAVAKNERFAELSQQVTGSLMDAGKAAAGRSAERWLTGVGDRLRAGIPAPDDEAGAQDDNDTEEADDAADDADQDQADERQADASQADEDNADDGEADEDEADDAEADEAQDDNGQAAKSGSSKSASSKSSSGNSRSRAKSSSSRSRSTGSRPSKSGSSRSRASSSSKGA